MTDANPEGAIFRKLQRTLAGRPRGIKVRSVTESQNAQLKPGDIEAGIRVGLVEQRDQNYVWIGPTEPLPPPGEVRIDSIKIGERFRKDPLFEIDPLVDSIREVDLLQPIGITADKRLVFGQRRIEAFKLLGRDTIPARVIPIDEIRVGEHDENECRLNFTPTERYAILQAIGRKPEGNQVNSQDLVSYPTAALRAGFSNPETARQVGKVIEHGTPELVDAMDKGEVSINAAAVITKQEPEVQRDIVKKPKRERKAAVRTLRVSTTDLAAARSMNAPPHALAQLEQEAVSMRIPHKPQGAAAAIIRNLSRDDIRELITALQAFLETPVLQ
jgi:ParB-like chromosome segregation protein Spo0J